MSTPMLVSTLDALRRHIQGKNRMHYVASRIMWRPAVNVH
jgi:hypothetical protein